MGLIVLGKYRLERSIGGGVVGKVYRARELASGAAVAVKEIRRDLNWVPRVGPACGRALGAAARVDSPAVGRLLDIAEEAGRTLLVSAWVDGEGLGEVTQWSDGRLPLGQTVAIFEHLLAALGLAHAAGLVHGDLKPQNVLIPRGGGMQRASLVDFGVGALLADFGVGVHGDGIVANLHYRAPEQLLDPAALTPAVDLYAIGALLYEVTVGHAPFPYDDPRAVVRGHLEESPRAPLSADPRVPAGLDALIVRALSKRPEDRFASAEGLREALLRVTAGGADLASPGPQRGAESEPPLPATVVAAAPFPVAPPSLPVAAAAPPAPASPPTSPAPAVLALPPTSSAPAVPALGPRRRYQEPVGSPAELVLPPTGAILPGEASTAQPAEVVLSPPASAHVPPAPPAPAAARLGPRERGETPTRTVEPIGEPAAPGPGPLGCPPPAAPGGPWEPPPPVFQPAPEPFAGVPAPGLAQPPGPPDPFAPPGPYGPPGAADAFGSPVPLGPPGAFDPPGGPPYGPPDPAADAAGDMGEPSSMPALRHAVPRHFPFMLVTVIVLGLATVGAVVAVLLWPSDTPPPATKGRPAGSHASAGRLPRAAPEQLAAGAFGDAVDAAPGDAAGPDDEAGAARAARGDVPRAVDAAPAAPDVASGPHPGGAVAPGDAIAASPVAPADAASPAPAALAPAAGPPPAPVPTAAPAVAPAVAPAASAAPAVEAEPIDPAAAVRRWNPVPVTSERAERAREWNARGFRAYREGRYEDALELYLRAIETDPNVARYYYNAACMFGLNEDPETAIRYLRQWMARDSRTPAESRRSIERDHDFEPIRDDPQMKAFLEALR